MSGRGGLPEPIGADVRRELERFPATGAMAAIVEAWPPAVGQPIATNAWPARISRDGTLYIATRSSTWAFELTQYAEMILERLQARVASLPLRGLRFAVGALPEVGEESVKTFARAVPEVRPEHRAEGERIARGISDSELRSAVARAVAASLAAQPTEPGDRPF